MRRFLPTCLCSGLIETSRWAVIAGDTVGQKRFPVRTQAYAGASESYGPEQTTGHRGAGARKALGVPPPDLSVILGVMSLLLALPGEGDMRRGGKERPRAAGPAQAPERASHQRSCCQPCMGGCLLYTETFPSSALIRERPSSCL